MLFSVLPFVAGVAGLSFLAAADGILRSAGAGLASAYFAAVGFSALLAGRRFHSARVGLVAAVTLVATHVAYVAAFTTGLIRGR
jgi:hypothetical protein